jgi:hypothetical protein
MWFEAEWRMENKMEDETRGAMIVMRRYKSGNNGEEMSIFSRCKTRYEEDYGLIHEYLMRM